MGAATPEKSGAESGEAAGAWAGGGCGVHACAGGEEEGPEAAVAQAPARRRSAARWHALLEAELNPCDCGGEAAAARGRGGGARRSGGGADGGRWGAEWGACPGRLLRQRGGDAIVPQCPRCGRIEGGDGS